MEYDKSSSDFPRQVTVVQHASLTSEKGVQETALEFVPCLEWFHVDLLDSSINVGIVTPFHKMRSLTRVLNVSSLFVQATGSRMLGGVNC